MNNWTDRVKSRMKELNMTQEMLANKLGITRGAVTHYLAGRRQPPLKQFYKLALVLKTNPSWLQYGTTTLKSSKINNKKTASNIPIPIPVLSWKQATKYPNTPNNLAIDQIEENLHHLFTDQTKWYALKIQGDAMTASINNHKSFQENDIIIIDPDRKAINGDYVIALLPQAKELTFKQYVIDGDKRYLKPLDPQYPIIEINDSTHIAGVIVGRYTNLAK